MAVSENPESSLAAASPLPFPLLPSPNRYITKNNTNGLGVFDTSVPELLPTEVADNLALHFGYATTSFPVDFTNEADLATYTSLLSNPPGIFLGGGSVLRIVDFQPGGETPLHQTLSIDYGVVLQGEIELVLDSGECRVMKKSDISVQRGTNHLWRNRSQTEWGRMLFITLGAKDTEATGRRSGSS